MAKPEKSDREGAIQSQIALGNPFVPKNGYCRSCYSDLYEDPATLALSKVEWVTGCPQCHSSFLD